MSGLTPTWARRQRDAGVAERRTAEAACALDFLVYGDEFIPKGADKPEPHASRCVFDHRKDGPCSRIYDPLPYPEAELTNPALYEGSAIGFLYGLPGTEAHAWQLAGWTLNPRSTR